VRSARHLCGLYTVLTHPYQVVTPDACIGVSWVKRDAAGVTRAVDPDACVGVSWMKVRDAEALSVVNPDVCVGVSWIKERSVKVVDPDVCVGVSFWSVAFPNSGVRSSLT
jgi:hypothetical protein